MILSLHNKNLSENKKMLLTLMVGCTRKRYKKQSLTNWKFKKQAEEDINLKQVTEGLNDDCSTETKEKENVKNIFSVNFY